jgi:hypothetical protein
MEWVKRPLLLPGSKPLATEDWIPKSQFLIANMTPTRTHASAAYVGYGLTQSCPFHGYGQFGDASNNGRWIEYDMVIPKADADLWICMVYWRGPNLGILDMKIDGVTVLTRDCYFGGGGYNQTITTAMLGPRTQTKKSTIRFQVNGKNASSTGYFGLVVAFGWTARD